MFCEIDVVVVFEGYSFGMKSLSLFFGSYEGKSWCETSIFIDDAVTRNGGDVGILV